MDLDTLKRYSKGELTAKQFLAVHRDAGELLDLLQEHLRPSEYLSSVQDWPEPKMRQQHRHFLVLKTMMLITPLILVGGTAFIFENPITVFLIALAWLTAFALIGFIMLYRNVRARKSIQGKSVLVTTNRRLLRVWLDGSEEVQGWWLGESVDNHPMEPVSATIRFLIELELGKPSLN